MTGFIHVAVAAVAVFSAACDRSAAGGAEEAKPVQTGVASFYGKEFAGKKTASGEKFKPEGMTAASRTLPLGTQVKVVNVESGESASVRINDRGPYAKGRVLDLSSKAARAVGIEPSEGVAKVTITPVATPAATAAPLPKE